MLMEATKCCVECNADFPLSGFYANAAGKCGRHALCKKCMNAKKYRSMARFSAMGDVRVPAAKICPMCKTERLPGEFSRHAHAGDGLRTYCRECDKIVRRSGKYGLSRDRVGEMLRQTRCESCNVHLPADQEKHIDHRHSDGAVRGVLCSRCNTTLGMCGDNTEILMRLCAYLCRTQAVDYRTQPYLEQIGSSMPISCAEPFSPEGTANTCQTNTPNHPISPHP